ncbi:MAG: SDR family oxidoreductase [Rhodospirillaceae bacterium]|nr:SDR family oxidoreductase [Rhodospirillaceae bacterium]
MIRSTMFALLIGAVTAWLPSEIQAAGGPVLVFGGNRGTGLEAVKAIKADGGEAVVFVRPTSDAAELKALGVATVAGDALNPADVKRAFEVREFAAVVSSLGGRRGEPRPDYEGTKNIADAAKAAGVTRIVIVTAIGTGDSRPAVSAETMKVLGPVYAEKVKGEDYVKASGLTYTIIRPGGLTNEPATGNGLLTEDKTVGGDITRADLGRLVADVIDDPATFNKVFSAVDRNKLTAGQMVPRQGMAPRTP